MCIQKILRLNPIFHVVLCSVGSKGIQISICPLNCQTHRESVVFLTVLRLFLSLALLASYFFWLKIPLLKATFDFVCVRVVNKILYTVSIYLLTHLRVQSRSHCNLNSYTLTFICCCAHTPFFHATFHCKNISHTLLGLLEEGVYWFDLPLAKKFNWMKIAKLKPITLNC